MTWIDGATLIGLVIAIFQLWQVSRVTRATQSALVQHAIRVGDYSVLLLVPELNRIELQCEREATDGRDRSKLSEEMHAWTQAASEIKGYLSQHGRTTEGVLAELQGAIVSVGRAKGRVLISEEDPLEVTKAARTKMGQVAATMTQYSAALRVSVEPPASPRGLRDLANMLGRKRR